LIDRLQLSRRRFCQLGAGLVATAAIAGWSPVYGGNEATSAYSADGESAFYKDEKYKKAFLQRAD